MTPRLSTAEKSIIVAAAFIRRSGAVLICRRPPQKRHGGLWEFPGGKVDVGETASEALQRELREELGVETVEVSDPVFSATDLGGVFEIVFLPVTIVGSPQALEHSELAWCPIPELDSYDLAPSDLAFAQFLNR